MHQILVPQLLKARESGWRRQWQPTPVLLSGKSHGERSLVGCSPWGRQESDTTEQLHFHFSLSCTGEGHGNPLQCSCLENPTDGGAWWAAIYGVPQSRTWLKWLSSSSSSSRESGTWLVKTKKQPWLLLNKLVFFLLSPRKQFAEPLPRVLGSTLHGSDRHIQDRTLFAQLPLFTWRVDSPLFLLLWASSS